MINQAITKTLALVGGGHAHIQVLKNLYENPVENLKIYLISDQVFAPYSGMLPGVLSELYTFDESHFDLHAISARAGVTFIHEAVTGIEDERFLVFENRPRLEFDVASINVGIQPKRISHEIDENVIPLKPISQFLRKWVAFKEASESYDPEHPPKVGIVGGGAAGVEIAFALIRNLRKRFPDCSIDLLEKGDKILAHHHDGVREYLTGRLENSGVRIQYDAEVEGYEKGILKTKDRKTRNFDFLFWATEAEPPVWFEKSDLPLGANGFLSVDRFLRVIKHKNVFAAGDCVDFPGGGLPKAGVYAVRQGPILSENIRRAVKEQKSLLPYEPQKRALAIITTGGKHAVASWGSRCIKGRLIWKWKDVIDRKFMRSFGAQSYPDKHLQPTGDGRLTRIPEIETVDVIQELGFAGPKGDFSRRLSCASPMPVSLKNMANGAFFCAKSQSPTGDYFLDAQQSLFQIMTEAAAQKVQLSGLTFSAVFPLSHQLEWKNNLRQLIAGFQSRENDLQLFGWDAWLGQQPSLTVIGFAKAGPGIHDLDSGIQSGDVALQTHNLTSGQLVDCLASGVGNGHYFMELVKRDVESEIKVFEKLQRGSGVKVMAPLSGCNLENVLTSLVHQKNLACHISVEVLSEDIGQQSSANPELLSPRRVKVPSGKKGILAHSALCLNQWHSGMVLITSKGNANELLAKLRDSGMSSAQLLGEFKARKKGDPIIVLEK